MADSKKNDEQEMSMEEILASIRKYVTEEGENVSPNKDTKEIHEPFKSKDDPNDHAFFELTDDMAVDEEEEKKGEKEEKKVSSSTSPSIHSFIDASPAPSPISSPVSQSFDAPLEEKKAAKTSPPTIASPPPQSHASAHSTMDNPMNASKASIVPSTTSTHSPKISSPSSHRKDIPMSSSAPAPSSDHHEARHEPSSSQKSNTSLLSDTILNSSAAALGKLLDLGKASHADKAPSAGLSPHDITLHEFMSDLARPILKDWLEQNLPSMVEEIVSKEIERIVEKIKI
jgi:hypothetical protein